MADVQLSSAFSAVVSVFHAAIVNVKTLRNHSPRGVKNERTIMEQWLLEALETAEHQISQRFSQYSSELGDAFAAGDDVALEKLSRIAILMQAGLVRSLQIAVESDKPDLDLSYLQEDALYKKKDTLDALDALRDRLLHPSSVSLPMSPHSNPLYRRPSLDSVATHFSAQTLSSRNSGSGPGMLYDEKDWKTSMTKAQTGRRSSSRKSSVPQDKGRVADAANPDWLTPSPAAMNPAIWPPAELEPQSPVDPLTVQMPDRYPLPPHSPTDWDKVVVVQPDPVLPPPAPSRPARPSHWSPASASSAFPPTQTPTASAPAPHSPSVRSPPHSSPTSSIPSRRPSKTPPQSPSTAWQTPMIPEGGEASHHRHNPFSFIRKRTNSMPAGPSTDMRGRPSKENNYWGFCKSAWDIRVEHRRGLKIHHREDGFHVFKTVWLCRTCAFLGDAFGSEKVPTVDPNIHTAASGIRYRWIFLAKSHAKKKPMEGASFGCVFCVSEGKPTGLFGNVEVLMNHIVVEHGRGIRKDILENNKCIFGRVASHSEDWDINIPSADGS